MGPRTTAWDTFFAAQVGASAALAGLIFVGLSINMARILSLPRLPERGLQTISILLTVLVVSSLFLVPGQPTVAIGVEILLVGAMTWSVNTWLEVGNIRKSDRNYRRFWLQNTFLGQAAVLPYIASGASILAFGLEGVYWLVPALMITYLKAVIDAWVLLIEINR